MSTRDDELDDLQRELESAPHIERPDAVGIRDGEVCWNDKMRICGAECMAYNTETHSPNGELVQGADKCLILLRMKPDLSVRVHPSMSAVAQTFPMPPDPYGTRR